MQTKRILCPNCKAVLEVKNSQNEMVKQITCPSCKTILQVKFQPQQEQPQQEPIEAKTYIAPPPKPQVANNGETQLVGNNGATMLGGPSVGTTRLATSAVSEGSLRLVYNDKPYYLKEGQNIVGRKGNTSRATVQIETEDRYMSRQHCSIFVTTLPDGTKKAVLSNYQNKNSTIIDGQEIETGEAIRLVNGNRIIMGHTTIVFKM